MLASILIGSLSILIVWAAVIVAVGATAFIGLLYAVSLSEKQRERAFGHWLKERQEPWEPTPTTPSERLQWANREGPWDQRHRPNP
jgi:hypothetical protein